MKYIWSQENITDALGDNIVKLETPSFGNILHFNSQDINQGDIFIALKGTSGDGHMYIEDAISRGASAIISNTKGIIVKDTNKALLQLAEYKRNNSLTKFCGVTGSVGKTSTKNFIHLLQQKFTNASFASRKNFNNQIGLPLNLSSIDSQMLFGVFELGMNHAGEMRYLSNILKPHIAVITNIGPVHLEFFNSIFGIADAKAEIMESTQEYIVLNSHNDYYNYLVSHANRYPKLQHFAFGKDCCIVNYHEYETSAEVSFDVFGSALSFKIPKIPMHQIENFGIALMVCALNKIKMSSQEIDDISIEEGRGNRLDVSLFGKSISLINDAYNASYQSIVASWNAASKMKKRCIMILADMLELGTESRYWHEKLAESISPDICITYGKEMFYLHAKLRCTKYHANSFEEILDFLKTMIKDQDLIVVKGSRGTKLYTIVETLKNYG